MTDVVLKTDACVQQKTHVKVDVEKCSREDACAAATLNVSNTTSVVQISRPTVMLKVSHLQHIQPVFVFVSVCHYGFSFTK